MNNQTAFNQWAHHSVINVNGVITSAQEAKVSILDRGFLYGDSIYEVIYSLDSNLIFFDDHIQRLFNSAKLLHMKIFLSQEEITKEILRTAKLSKISNAYIRVILTRGETQISLDPQLSFKNNFIIIITPKTIHSAKHYTKGVTLYIPKVLRNHIKSVNPNAKSGNYLNNVMAIDEAKKTGAYDALMINSEQEITEGTSFNIWMIKDKTLYTPPTSSGLLEGITRNKVIDICKKNNIYLKIKKIYQEDIFSADEVFITSSTRGVMPVCKVNNFSYGEGIDDWILTKKVSTLYQEEITREKNRNAYNYTHSTNKS